MNRATDETSHALIAAAHELLRDHGPEALTVRRIASAANMSTMNVYSRFGGKDGVIDEIFLDGHRRLAERVDAVPHTDDVAADLVGVAETYRRWALENPTYYAVMFRSAIAGFEPAPDSLALALQAMAKLVERVRRGQEGGAIAASDACDPVEIAAWLWATCHGMISFELDAVGEELVDWSSVYAHGIRVAVHGLHPSVAPVSA